MVGYTQSSRICVIGGDVCWHMDVYEFLCIYEAITPLVHNPVLARHMYHKVDFVYVYVRINDVRPYLRKGKIE